MNPDYQVTIRYQEQKNQKKGWWYLYYHTPNGPRPVLTQRQDPKRYRRLYSALKWAANKRPGYIVKIEVRCYSGILRQNQRGKGKEPEPE